MVARFLTVFRKAQALTLLLALFSCVRSGWAEPQPMSPHSNPDSHPTLVLRHFVAGAPMRLVAYGDMRFTDPKVTSGTNPKIRKWLAEKIGLERPDALLLTGDMPYFGDRKTDWEEFQRETASWRSDGFPILPAIGNHEVYFDHAQGISNYLDNFPDIERHRYYSALLGSVEVISLDMMQSASPRSDQGRWYLSQLDHIPPSVEFVLILYHIPWVADTQSQLVASLPSKDALLLCNALEARLDHLHAKVVVFSGHIHNYERFERHGVEYVVTGGGGAVPYPILFRGSHDLYRDSGFPVYHYLTISIRDHQLHGEMWKVINPDAPESALNVEKKDSFTVTANPSVPAKSQIKTRPKSKPR